MSTLDFDPEDMTVAEVEEVETRTGRPIGELFSATEKGDMPSGVQLRAIVFVLKRRTEPEFTWEQAGAVKLSAVAELSGPRPTEAAGSTNS